MRVQAGLSQDCPSEPGLLACGQEPLPGAAFPPGCWWEFHARPPWGSVSTAASPCLRASWNQFTRGSRLAPCPGPGCSVCGSMWQKEVQAAGADRG